MKHIKTYRLFESSDDTRTSPLTEEEFLEILNTKCTNYSLDNDQLFRGCGDVGQYALYVEKERKGTYGGGYHYHDFFNARKEYPVPRYKSTIGSSSVKVACLLGQRQDGLYLVIPYDNSKIIFCPTVDMAAGSGGGRKFELTDEMFTMAEYTKGFKINYAAINKCNDLYAGAGGRKMTIDGDLGAEFFTNSNCLLYRLGKGYDFNPGGNSYKKALVDKELDKFRSLINR